MQLLRLDHVSLDVSDRDRSIAWYRYVLGLPQRNEPTADDEPVFLGDPGLQFGLFRAPAALRHVALVVDDLDEARDRLRAQAIPFTDEDHGNARSVYFRDPDGHVIELTTYV